MGAPAGEARSSAGGVVILPIESYSDPVWARKAHIHRANVARVHAGMIQKLGRDNVRFLTTEESAVGGVGFWKNPLNRLDDKRYLGVFAYVKCPAGRSDYAYRDDLGGRVLKMFHAYGQDTIEIMSGEFKRMNDPDVLGAMIIFVYCRPGLNDLSADEDLEAVVLFMSRDTIDNFLGLRITTQEMFNRSLVWPVFQGPEKIKMLRQFVLQP